MITLDEMFQTISEKETVSIYVLDDCSQFNDFELPLPLHQYKVKSFYSMYTKGYKDIDSYTHINVEIIK